jgi:hypothetical protein
MKNKFLLLAALCISFAAGPAAAANVRANWDTYCAKCQAPMAAATPTMEHKLGIRDYRDPRV